MRRGPLLTSMLVAVCFLSGPGVWAQEDASDTFMLEEITVTAEKRAVNLQELPSSVVAMPGDELITQSKATTEQILESVPNVTFRSTDGGNPDGNIAIRGVQRTQSTQGMDNVIASTTAVYVDGIYQGIGGHYDVNRVEVLRGPQGTLYGRSATGGVVSFYTTDPKLESFGGNVSAEFGTDGLINVQGVLNVPVTDTIALRAAGHYYERDGLLNPEGGHTETREGRIKALYKPNDNFDVVLQAAFQKTEEWNGGYSHTLDAPGEINYNSKFSDISEDQPNEYTQFGITANYDFGDSVLTWVGGYHDYEYAGALSLSESISTGADGQEISSWGGFNMPWPKDKYQVQELRLTSDTEGQLSWLIGINYFKHEYDTSTTGIQGTVTGDPEIDPDQPIVERVIRNTFGEFMNWGVFTEETFEVRDDFRITAGLRYDRTELDQSMYFAENVNLSAEGNHIYPPVYVSAEVPEDMRLQEWDNVTYKLRFEYDLTPENMVYATIATGFLPGYVAVGPELGTDSETGYTTVTAWTIRMLDQQELTSFEIGTKNQFMENRLRLNASAFYYDLEGYPESFNLNDGGGGPFWVEVTVPLEMYGVEMSGEYLLTMNDKLSFNVGYLSTKITEYPGTIVWKSGAVTDGSQAMVIDEMVGHPEWSGSVSYDHTFTFSDGSTLVPRVELNYTGDCYLSNLNYSQVQLGLLPWAKGDSYVVCNANLTWRSASQKYSLTGWVRNALDEEYLAGVGLATRTPITQTSATPGDPRTFGVVLSAKF